MMVFDVNVLVYAHRQDTPDHERYLQFLEDVVNGDEAYGMADLVLSGFLRVVTHPKVFAKPTPPAKALAFAEELRSQPNCVSVVPGQRHWSIFLDLCKKSKATGNEIPDAYLAALAIESGSEWITTDRGFARYPGLKWRHPLR